jgi:nucleoside-diphosphate-sugar epimerase
MRNKTICVTGGSGFIAKHLIKALKKENPKEIINLDLLTGYNLTVYRELEVFFKLHNIDIVFDMATLPLPLSLTSPYKVVNDINLMALNLCEL